MSPAAPPDPSPIGLAILVALALAPIAWAALQFVRAWRARQAGARPEPMAWLRAMDPNHVALPSPTRQAPMLPAPRRWTPGRVAIYAAQAVAVAALTWSMFASVDPVRDTEAAKGLGFAPVLAIIIVAFATAVLTNLWAWTYGELQGLPFRAGRGVRALRRAVAPDPALHHHAREPEQPGALRFGGEAPERRRHLRIGE